MAGQALDGENPILSFCRVQPGSGVPFYEEGTTHSRTERRERCRSRTLPRDTSQAFEVPLLLFQEFGDLLGSGKIVAEFIWYRCKDLVGRDANWL
jgi:hypothetical protein